jgi:hypothetical protein
MNFPKVVRLLQTEFAKRDIQFALIGGLAIHALGISRTTRDVDGLALLSSAEDIDEIMRALGYESDAGLETRRGVFSALSARD